MHARKNLSTGVKVDEIWVDTCYTVKRAGKGRRLLVLNPANTVNVLLSSIVVNLGDSSVRTQ